MPPRKSSRNVEMLGIVAKGLKELKEKVVFVGGATIDLFITDPAAPGTRETDDVDCVIELVGTPWRRPMCAIISARSSRSCWPIIIFLRAWKAI